MPTRPFRVVTMAKARKARKPAGSAWQRAEEFGVDMTLLENSLRMTPAERVEAHERALALAEEVRRAGAATRARRGTTGPKTR